MSRYTEKTEISRDEYLQLWGLLALAKHHEEALTEIERAACAITGEEIQMGHTSDHVYGASGDWSADRLLEVLGITVAATPTPETTDHDE